MIFLEVLIFLRDLLIFLQDIFVGGLRALAPELMSSVTVLKQSDSILADPSNYWISVINAGRAHKLAAVRACDEASEHVSQVRGWLWHIYTV